MKPNPNSHDSLFRDPHHCLTMLFMNSHKITAFAFRLVLLTVWISLGTRDSAAADRVVDHFPEAANSGCMACHGGIELIREPDSQMMQDIIALGTVPYLVEDS